MTGAYWSACEQAALFMIVIYLGSLDLARSMESGLLLLETNARLGYLPRDTGKEAREREDCDIPHLDTYKTTAMHAE